MEDAATTKDALKVMRGGVDVSVTFRDDTKATVKVRQLPFELLAGPWSALTGDEAGRVELYCDKQDLVTRQRLLVLQARERRLLAQIEAADDDAKFEALEESLSKLRDRIATFESEHPRWDDLLTPESHDEIVRIGDQLNRPRFDRWTQETAAAIGQMKVMSSRLSQQTSETSSPTSASS